MNISLGSAMAMAKDTAEQMYGIVIGVTASFAGKLLLIGLLQPRQPARS